MVHSQLMINPPEAPGARIVFAQPNPLGSGDREVARCCAEVARDVAGSTWQPTGNGIVNFTVVLRDR
jgi:hypothetical protein